MPVSHLVFVGVMAVSVLGALIAPARPAWLGVVSAALATLPNELPLLVLLLVAQSTWGAIADGGLLDTTAGWMVLGAVITLEVALLVLLARGLRARSAVAAALSRTFGGSTSVRPVRGVPHTLLTPFAMRPRGVVRTGNVRYGSDSRRQRLDVYRSRRPTSDAAPTLLYLHGGAYHFGSKRRESRAMLHHFARLGWVCISADYRVRPTVRHPDHLIDVKRALVWTREHAGELGADAGTVVVAGSSAGAHLAAQMALTQNEPALQPGFEDDDTTVEAAICLYGHYGPYFGLDGTERPSSSPLAHDVSHAPPFFIAHGDHDSQLPVAAARAMADKLATSSSAPVVYVELPGAQHGFDLVRSPRSDAVLAGIDTFLHHVVDHGPDTSHVPGTGSRKG